MYIKIAAVTAVALTLSACGSPKNYETVPVIVTTPQGVVTCQLYTKEIVLWDRSIKRPEKMSVESADAICHNEGKLEKRGG